MKIAHLSLVFLLALGLTACVADDEEYDAALRRREEYRAQLRELYQTNDTLNREITGLYAECAALSDQLAVFAASKVHLEYTKDLLAAPVRPRQRPRGAF